ncbi:copper resistance system multicopper oxidase [Parvularcula dongshanensis]|uniref:CopA family copper-resistance protein n=1 Tax=Parvularcula dongshanensis TaxID=1173995 RepID=A0A840I4N6_9PROT|nr:copper resistance system multicopper oxidase [Parvularcula dongshanensis]MBB4659926.1 CopA family copper-resistance protein [Parvularcula dongshanensis]
MQTRRAFLGSAAGTLAASALVPAWARSAVRGNTGIAAEHQHLYDFTIARTPLRVNGRATEAVTVNGGVPAPLMRMREGQEVVMRVKNTLDEPTSIHWHGLLVPFTMDGVPGVSFPGIEPGETFEYRFPLRQSGTYWYHSHSGLQEQIGHYGPIVIDPAGRDPIGADREYVLVLGDWTYMDPYVLFHQLKTMSDSLNFQKRTLGDLFADAEEDGLGAAVKNRMAWGKMRMTPTDIADVTGETYTYLINGHGPEDDWTALFEPGQRVRMRVINASAMSLMNVRIPGLPLRMVASDGNLIRPLMTDEFQIGPAETYDFVVEPEDRAYRIVAASIDGSGQALGTLTPRLGETAEAPPLRPRPLLTMKDMGMAGMMGMDDPDAPGMIGQGHDQPEPAREGGHASMAGMDHGAMGHEGMNHGAMGHEAMAGMDAGPKGGDMKGMHDMQKHDHPMGPGVASVAMMPVNRLDEPGIGLETVPHRTLTYAQLAAHAPNPDTRAPGREVELHLTSNMERYMWSFDGVKFSEVTQPITFYEGERVRLTMVNDTMMPHPIHVHGMFFDVVVPDAEEPGVGERYLPRKHTIVVKPGEKLSVDITADEVGDWAFHCHLLYHMHAGMMQVVSVLPKERGRPMTMREEASSHEGMGHDGMDHGSMDHGGHH